MRVLLAADFSGGDDVVIRHAVSLSSAPGDALGAVALPHASDAVRERIRSLCGREVETLVDKEVDCAAIARGAEIWKADLLVVGGQRNGGPRTLGVVAEAAVRNAPCNVLVVRPVTGCGRVLATTDLSDSFVPAVTAAAAEARRRDAQLEVVQALGFLDVEAIYLLGLGTPSVVPMQSVFEIAARKLSDRVAGLRIEATCKVLDRPAATAIVGEAESIGADLIVVGSRPRTWLSRLALGSVADKVIRSAPCSVLVVRRSIDRDRVPSLL